MLSIYINNYFFIIIQKIIISFTFLHIYLFLDKNCSADQFTCANNYSCVPLSWKCNGINECGDNSDEVIVFYGLELTLIIFKELMWPFFKDSIRIK